MHSKVTYSWLPCVDWFLLITAAPHSGQYLNNLNSSCLNTMYLVSSCDFSPFISLGVRCLILTCSNHLNLPVLWEGKRHLFLKRLLGRQQLQLLLPCYLQFHEGILIQSECCSKTSTSTWVPVDFIIKWRPRVLTWIPKSTPLFGKFTCTACDSTNILLGSKSSGNG